MGEEQKTLLPELVSGKADANRRAAAELGRVRRWAARNAREALRYTVGERDGVRHFWRQVQAALEEGLEGHQARRAVQATLDLLDSWAGLEDVTRRSWKVAEQAGAPSEGLDQLDAATREIEVIRASAEELRALLTRPLPPPDPAALERGRKAIAEGRYKDADGMRASTRKSQG